MKNKTKYTNEPMGRMRIVDDFLPRPDELVLKEDKVKITLSLSRESLEFFKKEAKKQKISYQKMIRKVIDIYASHFQRGA